MRLALQERQQHGGLIRAVHAGLNRLLKHCVDRSRTEVVRELLHQFAVKVRAIVSVLVHIDTHWNDTEIGSKPLTHIHGHTVRHQTRLSLSSSSPVQTTFELLLWLFSAEMWLVLRRVSGGEAVTDDAPRDCTTRGLFWSRKQTRPLSLALWHRHGLLVNDLLTVCFALLHMKYPVAHTSKSFPPCAFSINSSLL